MKSRIFWGVTFAVLLMVTGFGNSDDKAAKPMKSIWGPGSKTTPTKYRVIYYNRTGIEIRMATVGFFMSPTDEAYKKVDLDIDHSWDDKDHYGGVRVVSAWDQLSETLIGDPQIIDIDKNMRIYILPGGVLTSKPIPTP